MGSNWGGNSHSWISDICCLVSLRGVRELWYRCLVQTLTCRRPATRHGNKLLAIITTRITGMNYSLSGCEPCLGRRQLENRQIPLLQQIPFCPGRMCPNSMQHLSQVPWGLWQQMVWQQEQHPSSEAFSAVLSVEGGTAQELQRDPTALCSSSKPPLPHTHSSLSLWSDGVRGNGQERAGAGIELHPGHGWAPTQTRQPVSASCCCWNAWAALVAPVLGLHSQGDPSHREIQVTGKFGS